MSKQETASFDRDDIPYQYSHGLEGRKHQFEVVNEAYGGKTYHRPPHVPTTRATVERQEVEATIQGFSNVYYWPASEVQMATFENQDNLYTVEELQAFLHRIAQLHPGGLNAATSKLRFAIVASSEDVKAWAPPVDKVQGK